MNDAPTVRPEPLDFARDRLVPARGGSASGGEGRTGLVDFLKQAADALGQAGVPRPRWTAEQLLSRRLGCQPVELYLGEYGSVIAGSPPLADDEAISFFADVAASTSGVPLQYLLSAADFYGREFLVGPGVFIPRPETEVLIDVALGIIRNPQSAIRNLVDVGTGCGAIAATLALERPELRVVAVDCSAAALKFARQNALRHSARVYFFEGDLVSPLAEASVDLMVANLPYLNSEESETWPRELHWEPWLALDGGKGGLSLINKLIQQAGAVLRPQGKLVLEIGHGQAGSVCEMAQSYGFRVEQVACDLAGLERVVVLSLSSLRGPEGAEAISGGGLLAMTEKRLWRS